MLTEKWKGEKKTFKLQIQQNCVFLLYIFFFSHTFPPVLFVIGSLKNKAGNKQIPLKDQNLLWLSPQPVCGSQPQAHLFLLKTETFTTDKYIQNHSVELLGPIGLANIKAAVNSVSLGKYFQLWLWCCREYLWN